MLEIKNLSVNYGYVNALKEVNINIHNKDIVSIIGSNGAGKTSLLRAISGLIKDVRGEILFDNADILNMTPEGIVEIGIVHCPEGRKIFPQFTVEENLKIGAYLKKNKIKNMNFEFEKVFNFFPRLKERRKQIAGTLSGGEQQMLAIGRAIMASPKILLLDEPSLGLAPILVNEIFEIIKKINKENVTILIVEQNANMALKISDYAYAIETGRVVFEGKAQDILNNESVKKAYLGA